MADKPNGQPIVNGHHHMNGGNNFNHRFLNGKKPFLIGVAGGTASGKSTVCKRIIEKLELQNLDQTQRQVVCISQDSFYRELTPEEKQKAEKGQFNFDHPVLRDIKERGRDLDQVLNQYTSFVKVAFEEFCLPTKKFADVIIPRGADNTVAISLIMVHIQKILHGEVNATLGRCPAILHDHSEGIIR
ncbi:hypothetical protein B566_EDAN017908 [Ephemera danica]|nr:hypothetical protein B566_EDAN017908 [Ephemera danica]